MRSVLILASAAILTLASPAAAKKEMANSVEEFAAATSSCLSALVAEKPEGVLSSLESDGWELAKTTPIGGIFRKGDGSIRLEFQNILGSHVCTVLGHRIPANSDATFFELIDSALKGQFEDGLSNPEMRSASEASYVVDNRFKAVVTLDDVQGDFDTKVTTIAN